mgnify:CR=1 FL=1
MKKQILILILFVAAIVAGTSNAFGQNLPASTTDVPWLNCTSTDLQPLHPMPGIPYTYSMDGTTGEEDVAVWTWFATKDSTFIEGAGIDTANMLYERVGELLQVSDNYGVIGSAYDTVQITWSSQILSETVYQGGPGDATFVVGYAEGVNCADNIQVYEINPRPAFTLDIANVDPLTNTSLDYGIDTAQCVDDVQSAIYNSADDSLYVDYGADTLYFEIGAANFVESWNPRVWLDATSLNGSQTAEILIAESQALAEAGTPVTGTTEVPISVTDTINFADVYLTAANPADITTGVSVWVRVIITNHTYESLASNDFVIHADGVDASGQWDMEDDDCDPATATNEPDGVDDATHTIRPRPTITDTTDDTLPDPDTFVPKTGMGN